MRRDAGKDPGRFGALEDLVGATVFLCSDAARYVTGQLLHRRRLYGVDLMAPFLS